MDQPLGGTVMYSPPYDEELTYGWDIWACGVVLYVLVNYQYPFNYYSLKQKQQLILAISPDLSDGISFQHTHPAKIERSRKKEK